MRNNTKTVRQTGWQKRFRENMRTFQHSHCHSCRRMSYMKLLHQRQQLRGTSISRAEKQLKNLRLGRERQNFRRGTTLAPKQAQEELRSKADVSAGPEFASTILKTSALLQNPKVPKDLKSDQKRPSQSLPPATYIKKRSIDETYTEETPLNSFGRSGQVESKRQRPSQSFPPSTLSHEARSNVFNQPPSEQKSNKKSDVSSIHKSAGAIVKPQVASPGTEKPPQAKARSDQSAGSKTALSKTWPSKVGTPKIRGLENPGMYCYRRSVLQSLLCVPQLTNLLSIYHAQCNKACVVCALRDLIIAYQSSGNVGRALHGFDSAIARTGRKSDPHWTAITPSTQEDAHDFILYLLETIEKGRGVPKSAFQATYKIKHRATWTCRACNKVHINNDSNPPSVTMPVPISGSSLATCLEAQHVETGTTILCDGCKKQAKRTRYLEISHAPEVLTIHLKRFEYDGRRMSKNSRHIDIPETLDLSKWAVDKSAAIRYKLQAVVLQSGSLCSGHYTAYVKGASGWRDISDSHVSEMEIRKLKERTRATPYVLTYLRI